MSRLRDVIFAGLIAGLPFGAAATEVNVVGLFPGKALVSINGGSPRMLAAGQKTPEGVMLVSAGGDSALLDIDGKRRSLRMGEAYAAQAAANGDETVTLTGDTHGHYNTVGAINGRSTQFLLDTGATSVWLSSELANRLNIPYRSGEQFTVATAGGPKTAWRVMLDNVRVGGITVDKVEAAVGEGAGTGDTALLGMTFLSRLTMHRDGTRLVLSRKEGLGKDANDKRPRLVLKEGGGMFATSAVVNGSTLPFIVDTGATNVSIDVPMAQQMGLNYQKGTPAMGSTANGPVRVWLVKFDTVSVGPITMYNVEGTVREGPALGVGLLGMSFLNRIEMRREGQALTLIKRF
jgi:aspartyl protease family protein